MRIANVPGALQTPSHRYPPHAVGVGIEEYFGQYAREHAAGLDTDWIYLPVYWTNNYVRSEFAVSPRAQQVLDSLDERERYFTIVQCDDGIYGQLPSNVLAFGAGGTGDIPIPLLCSPPHPRPACVRDTLVSFMGTVECGGPVAGETDKSSWDVDGAGARTRRAMFEAFKNKPGCFLHNGDRGVNAFRIQLGRSHFALAPRGYGRTSFRLYEAMDLGCVPVYIHDDGPWFPYGDVLDWDSFSISCPTIAVVDLPERLLQVSSEWRDNAREVIVRLLPDYFTMEGMSRQIFRMIGERT